MRKFRVRAAATVGLVLLIGVLVGVGLGLMFVDRYMVREMPRKAVIVAYNGSELKVEPLGQGKLTSYDSVQKTAPIHVLEPKVADVYFQWAPNQVQNTAKTNGQRDLLQ